MPRRHLHRGARTPHARRSNTSRQAPRATTLRRLETAREVRAGRALSTLGRSDGTPARCPAGRPPRAADPPHTRPSPGDHADEPVRRREVHHPQPRGDRGRPARRDHGRQHRRPSPSTCSSRCCATPRAPPARWSPRPASTRAPCSPRPRPCMTALPRASGTTVQQPGAVRGADPGARRRARPRPVDEGRLRRQPSTCSSRWPASRARPRRCCATPGSPRPGCARG